MADMQPKNTESTKWMTSFLPVAAPVTDEEGKEVPVKDALETQREQFKAAEEAEKAEAEKAEEEAADEDKEDVDAEEDEEVEKPKTAKAKAAKKDEESTPADTLASKDAAPKNEPATKKPADAGDAGNKATATKAGDKAAVNK